MRFLPGLALVLWAAGAAAAPDADIEVPATPGQVRAVTAESRFNHGQALARQNDWAGAEGAYREAARLRPEFPEAWNGLGYALRKQGRLDESVQAYREALRLRPKYAQALEYLGQAYVQLGRITEARDVLARLRPLDREEAEELARAIAKAARR